MPLEIRVGLPSPGGGLARAARALGFKVMISANSFFRRDEHGEVVAVRRPGPDLAGVDAALDSSGYVAMRRYGGYSWPLEAYVFRVVASFPWAWYSAPDYSCEPALAGCRTSVRFRLAETVALYGECARIARRAGLPGPVPVLQGWWPEDYQRCWDMLVLPASVPLVGIGSVCSRPVHGPDGLMAVLERLDRVLPAGVQLHLYGVKSQGIETLMREDALGGRVRSVDSMAWDVEARARHRTGRTIARRVAVMREWHAAQTARADRAAAAAQHGMPRAFYPRTAAVPPSGDEILESWLDLLASGEVDLAAALNFYAQECYASGAATLAPAPQRRTPAAPASRLSTSLVAARQVTLPLGEPATRGRRPGRVDGDQSGRAAAPAGPFAGVRDAA